PNGRTIGGPHATLAGNATDSGSGIATITFQERPVGGTSWTTIGTTTSAPYQFKWDTTTVPTGDYDLQLVATDNAGNSRVSSIVAADGSTPAAASSIVLDTSEVVTINGATLDGQTAPAPVITGTRVAFQTGALAAGPHTLAGSLVDAAGKTTPFRLHFTVWMQGAGGDPYVEKNSNSNVTTALTAPDAAVTATMPAGAYPTTSTGDWLVLRVDPQ